MPDEALIVIEPHYLERRAPQRLAFIDKVELSLDVPRSFYERCPTGGAQEIIEYEDEVRLTINGNKYYPY